ncbi:hypothetical protein L7F22_062404 [Adiantum nelumboides]|nr:hypothetical protein [Adiantum nelumboides]
MAEQAEEIALLKAQVAEMSAVLALPQVKDFLKTLAKGKEKGQKQRKEHDVNAHSVTEEGEPSKKPWDEDIPELSSPSYSPPTSFSYSSDSSSSSNPRRRMHRCSECGQSLPESYEPPRNEPWTTGICGCADDVESFWLGLACPCVLFGRNVQQMREDIPWTTPCTCHAIFVEGGLTLAAATLAFHGLNPHTSFLIGEGLLFAWWMCGIYTGLFRQQLQRKYHLQDSPCDPCVVHCCMHWCAICQEHREMQGRLSDDAIEPMTVINPPAHQEMQMPENQQGESADSKQENETAP